ncbi:MAG: porin [Gemmatimonadota bacterium]
MLSGAEAIDLSGRVQVQAITSSCSERAPDAESPCVERVPGFDLFARRVRTALEVKVNDWISGEIQPDFGAVSGVELKNAYGRLTFGPGAKLQVGQFKKPFDGFHLTSSTQILTIERDLDIPGVPGPRALSTAELTTRNRISSYDLGVMLFGELGGGLGYRAGVFNGQAPEANGDVNTDKQFVGRLRYSTTAGDLPVSVAVAGALTDLPYTGAGGRLGGQTYGDAEVFAEVGDFEGGPHLQAGYVFGTNALETPQGGTPNPPAAELATMNTWQAIGSWKLAVEDVEHVEAVEPVFRVTRSEPNTEVAGDEVWGFTPGVQVFFDGRNKIALNWDVVTFAGDTPSANSFKAQYQFHF